QERHCPSGLAAARSFEIGPRSPSLSSLLVGSRAHGKQTTPTVLPTTPTVLPTTPTVLLGRKGDRDDPDILDRAVTAFGGDRLELVHDVHPVGHLPEDGVLAVEPRTGLGCDEEELGAVGVRPRVGHRKRAADDLVRVDLVLECVPGTTR